jgi:membrane protease YdiL (CAAX protease family)
MVLVFAAFFLSGYVAGRPPVGDTPGAMVSVILFGAPQVLLILYILDLQPAASLAEFGVAPLAARDLLGLIAVFLGTFAVLSPLLIVLLLLPGAGWELSGYRWQLQSPLQLPLALAFSVVGAYREELFFRSYLLTRLGQLGVPAAWAAAASTALFALGHWYEGLLGLAVAGLLGIYFSVIFLRTRNLHTIALAHALYNFTVLCSSLLAPFALPDNGKRATL